MGIRMFLFPVTFPFPVLSVDDVLFVGFIDAGRIMMDGILVLLLVGGGEGRKWFWG